VTALLWFLLLVATVLLVTRPRDRDEWDELARHDRKVKR
jgi:hypothetical protein